MFQLFKPDSEGVPKTAPRRRTWRGINALRTMLPLVAIALGACARGAPERVPGRASEPLPRSHFLHDHTGVLDSTIIQVVVEIPSGTNDKWQVNKLSGALEWEQQDGAPRVVQYLSYPGNYGLVPQTLLPAELGGDGDPLDVLLLGPARERGAVVPARVIGALRLLDDGERDDKLLAVGLTGPLSDVHSLRSLDAHYPGVRQIIELWFANYKGRAVVTPQAFTDADSAMMIVHEASRMYRTRSAPDPARR